MRTILKYSVRSSPYIVAGISTFFLISTTSKTNCTSREVLKAICQIGPNGKACTNASDSISTTHVSGIVSFEDDGEKCIITYRIKGLKPGKHGFHMYVNFVHFCNEHNL